MQNNEFLTRVAKNKKFKRLVEMRENGLFAEDTAKYIKELETLHATRKMRHLKTRELLQSFSHEATDISLQNSSFRSRAVEIKKKFYKLSSLLEEHLTNMKNYLATYYAETLSSCYRTQEMKKKALDYVLSDFERLSARYKLVSELSDLVIDDIDQAGWTIKNIIEVQKMVADRA